MRLLLSPPLMAGNWIARAVPTAYALLFITSLRGTPARLSLFVDAVNWGVVFAWSILPYRRKQRRLEWETRTACWTAGALLAFARLSDKASGDVRVVVWAKAFVPLLVTLISGARTMDHFLPRSSREPERTSPQQATSGGWSTTVRLGLMTALASSTLSPAVVTSQTLALTISSSLSTAIAFILMSKVFESLRLDFTAHDAERKTSPLQQQAILMRSAVAHFALILTVVTGVLSSVLEADTLSASFMPAASVQKVKQASFDQDLWGTAQDLGSGIIMAVVQNVCLLWMLSNLSASISAFTTLCAALLSHAWSRRSLWDISVTAITLLTGFMNSSGDQKGSSSSWLHGATAGRLLNFLLILSIVYLTWMRGSEFTLSSADYGLPIDTNFPSQATTHFAPSTVPNNTIHPVDYLVREARSQHEAMLNRQSTSFEAAVAEYRRRYKMHPPPKFDIWYNFAKAHDVKLIDEFDNIYDMLLPFWSIPPATLRARVREAIGYVGNNVLACFIRRGKITLIDSGHDWQQKALRDMLGPFLEHLPDMDLGINLHDESRIVIPHDRLAQMISIARDEKIPAAFAKKQPRNVFSGRPFDLPMWNRVEDFRTTRFNQYNRQPTWAASRLSCPLDSPARVTFDDHSENDNLTAYSITELGFISNQTAMTDICNSPSLSSTHGFFSRSNIFNVAHDLFPVFSQSKISSFQDLVFPPLWYYAERAPYHAAKDVSWADKEDKMFWRGSTTGGFSRGGDWRRQHRQNAVKIFNANDQAMLYSKYTLDDGSATFQPTKGPRVDSKSMVDVHFSHVGQCDPEDCDAQKEFFTIKKPVDLNSQWKYRHLLDIDGNAFSGRFYAFLQSSSLVYKMSLFREWHMQWLTPWVHYVPLSFQGNEWLETVKYFSKEGDGEQNAHLIALEGKQWAATALRKEDMQAWMFRMLLEYARVIDNDRENIGYA